VFRCKFGGWEEDGMPRIIALSHMAGLLIKTSLTAKRSSVGDLYTSYCSEIDHVATLFVNPTVIS